MKRRRIWLLWLAMALIAASCAGGDDTTGDAGGSPDDPATADEDQEDSDTESPGPGITDDEVVIGATAGLTGPAAVFGEGITDGMELYFDKVNEAGGVEMADGVSREVRFIVYDDGFEPARGIENSRRLCEQDSVFALVGSVGVPATAQEEYVNESECPSLFIAGGQLSLSAPENHYQMPLWPPISSEGAVYGRYISEENPDATIAFLKLTNPIGDDFSNGLNAALEEADAPAEIVAEETVEATDASVETQMTRLANSGADTFVFVGAADMAPQVVTFLAEREWDPQTFFYSAIAAPAVLEPAGLDNAEGLVSATWLRDPADESDPAIQEYLDAGGPPGDQVVLTGWAHGAAWVKTLELMEAPTREALMETVYSLDEVELAPLAEGITMNTSEDDSLPIEAYRLNQFQGGSYDVISDVIDVSDLVTHD